MTKHPAFRMFRRLLLGSASPIELFLVRTGAWRVNYRKPAAQFVSNDLGVTFESQEPFWSPNNPRYLGSIFGKVGQ